MKSWITDSVSKAGWAPILVFVAHAVLSKGLDAYVSIPMLDVPMHLLGGVAIAHFVWVALRQPQARIALGTLSRFGQFVLGVASVATSTVLWEFAEWTFDHLGWAQVQLGLADTLLDMLLGIVGGVAYLGVRWLSSPVSVSEPRAGEVP